MIKMVNEFKLTVVHFARPNPMQICACAWIYRWTKKLWKIRTGQDWTGLGHRAAGPSRAVGRGPLGLRAAGPLGRGPLGRGPAFSKTPWKSINFVTPWVTTNKFGECVSRMSSQIPGNSPTKRRPPRQVLKGKRHGESVKIFPF